MLLQVEIRHFTPPPWALQRPHCSAPTLQPSIEHFLVLWATQTPSSNAFLVQLILEHLLYCPFVCDGDDTWPGSRSWTGDEGVPVLQLTWDGECDKQYPRIFAYLPHISTWHVIVVIAWEYGDRRTSCTRLVGAGRVGRDFGVEAQSHSKCGKRTALTGPTTVDGDATLCTCLSRIIVVGFWIRGCLCSPKQIGK